MQRGLGKNRCASMRPSTTVLRLYCPLSACRDPRRGPGRPWGQDQLTLSQVWGWLHVASSADGERARDVSSGRRPKRGRPAAGSARLGGGDKLAGRPHWNAVRLREVDCRFSFMSNFRISELWAETSWAGNRFIHFWTEDLGARLLHEFQRGIAV